MSSNHKARSHFQFTGRTCGMGIRRGTGILPVSCLLPGGQDAHSTPIQREDSATPEK
ncbi:MAG: hypothetical protein F6K63_22650 [Moorea sp. SIO1G6]|uniref:Uncharacterized protein n=1 Tax=Moorena producens (strain JHB) TaxID=1454205 RepID=A0A9Q9UVZ3_MOOP1|nr:MULTISPECIES: hypothetical protein [Moorena]NET67035.1 hypothetical protein [Moorena sp. SIO1G6]WAN69334.1 hypothetical protein BJP36_44050 [Moorena producens JHB]